MSLDKNLGKIENAATDDKGFSEETCVRCGWRMGSPALNCHNDNTPHVFPSQAALLAKAETAEARTKEATRLYTERNQAHARARAAEAEAAALAEGREGMVTAYDHEGRYVGCIGSETWRWLIDHPEVDAPALIRAHEMFAQAEAGAEADALDRAYQSRDDWKQEAERLKADRDAAVRAAEQAREALRQIGYLCSESRETLDVYTAIRDINEVARAALTGDGTNA